MESAAYNSMDGLYKFLCKFLPTNGQNPPHTSEDEDADGQAEVDAAVSSETKTERIQGACVYCGLPVAHMPMDIGGFQDNICPLCKEELIWQKDQFHQIVDETIRNMKYMCSIPWDKSIRIQKYSNLKLKKSGPRTAKARKKRKASPTWAVSLEPRFVQAEMDDARSMCIFKIRTAIPVGIVVASVAYTAAYACLCIIAENQKLDRERMTGLSYWYLVYYLHCMDYERYGCRYDHVVEQLIPKSGVTLYRELQENRCNPTSQVFSILQDLTLAQQQENRSTIVMQTILHQDKNKPASDTHNARGK